MKKILTLILTLFILSCTKKDETIIPPLHTYQFSTNEIELLNRINIYRDSIGLNTLQTNQHISYLCQEHNLYMIDNDVINHDYFQYRADNLQKTLGAERVGENIAYNYNTPEAAVKAWLNSASHKQNIEGNFTHFGIAIRENATTGKKYYTNIFVRI